MCHEKEDRPARRPTDLTALEAVLRGREIVLRIEDIVPGEPKRAGRWRWFNNTPEQADDKKECGLHYNI